MAVPEGLVVPGVEQGVVAGARHGDHMADEECCNIDVIHEKQGTKGQRNYPEALCYQQAQNRYSK